MRSILSFRLSGNHCKPQWITRYRFALAVFILAVGMFLCPSFPVLSAKSTFDEPISFNSQIRTILASKCLACHGPDEEDRQADLRLDTFEGATDWAIVPGDPDSSDVIERISSDDPDLVMPPADSGKTPLTDEEKNLIQQWIREGAQYQTHWSFVKPKRPELPTTEAQTENQIDAFVLAKLQQAGLTMNPTADKATLARRVALDLTGLPPDPKMLERFLQDDNPEAYAGFVQQLLDSPNFGEHWATYWLDLARYADTDGYADDNPRTIWPYRDWVIRAINQDMPFDQFTLQQLAGDLLPEANNATRIATGFHRNTLTNNEGGTIDEEYRVEAVKDRVDTTMQVWSGLTFGCAKCHSHKYDPISHHDYYQLFAIFNQSADSDRPGNPPFLQAYSLGQSDQVAQWQERLDYLNTTAGSESPEFKAKFAQWKATWDQMTWGTAAWKADPNWHSFDWNSAIADNGTQLRIDNASQPPRVFAEGPSPDSDVYRLKGTLATATNSKMTALELSVETVPYANQTVPGRSPGNGNFVISEVVLKTRLREQQTPIVQMIRISVPGENRMIHLAEVEAFDAQGKPLKLGELSDVTQSSTDFGGEVGRLIDGNTSGVFQEGSVNHTKVEKDPWVEVRFAEPQSVSKIVLHNRTDGDLFQRLNGVQVSLLDEQRAVVSKQTVEQATLQPMPFVFDGWRRQSFAYASADHEQSEGDDPWSAWKMIDGDFGKKGWAVGGQQRSSHVAILQLDQAVEWNESIEVAIEVHQNYGAQHTLTNVAIRWTDRSGPNLVVPVDRSQAESVFARSKPLGDQIGNEIASLKEKLSAVPSANSPVMEELPLEKQRETRLLIKGSYLSPGEVVQPRLPHYFYTEETPANRLDLAQWLVSEANPLTARVTVNRIWARMFGRGLVETEEDFGTMGTLPSHAELLDWLAVEFQTEMKWSRKELLKQIVTSDTYRQASTTTVESEKVDPENRLFSHAPRFRLSAEQIRDQALTLAGLLNREMYGPSVVPRLPVKELGSAFSGRTINESEGADLYRRGLYTYVRRTGPYPTTLTFDGTNRQVCTVRRIRTNTPLQALVTLNDPVYFEAAQGFARRILLEVAEGSENDSESALVLRRMSWALQQATCRMPSESELQAMIKLYQQQKQGFNETGVDENLLVDPIGPLPGELKDLPLPELAAWTVVANVILNLDEVLTR